MLPDECHGENVESILVGLLSVLMHIGDVFRQSSVRVSVHFVLNQPQHVESEKKK